MMQASEDVKKGLLAFAQNRKMQFEEGEPFHFHAISDAEQALAVVAEAEKEVLDAQAEVSASTRALLPTYSEKCWGKEVGCSLL